MKIFKVELLNVPRYLWTSASFIESLRQILEANYNYAYNKYGEEFSIERVDNYSCVKIARGVLKKYEITTVVTCTEEPVEVHNETARA